MIRNISEQYQTLRHEYKLIKSLLEGAEVCRSETREVVLYTGYEIFTTEHYSNLIINKNIFVPVPAGSFGYCIRAERELKIL